jgi:hypothetical protein
MQFVKQPERDGKNQQEDYQTYAHVTPYLEIQVIGFGHPQAKVPTHLKAREVADLPSISIFQVARAVFGTC